MSKSQRNVNIYTMLPRFVTEIANDSEKPRFLPIIERSFERNGVNFKFEISPAFMQIENVGTSHFYPGAIEEIVESALRRLAVEDNPNFIKSEDSVVFSLSELISEIETFGENDFLTRDQIDHSLKILWRTAYELAQDNAQMTFRAIERLSEREIDGEKYYLAQFSSFFLNGSEVFDWCFRPENHNTIKF